MQIQTQLAMKLISAIHQQSGLNYSEIKIHNSLTTKREISHFVQIFQSLTIDRFYLFHTTKDDNNTSFENKNIEPKEQQNDKTTITTKRTETV